MVGILRFRKGGCESSDDDKFGAKDVGCGDENLPASKPSGYEESSERPTWVGEGVKHGIVQDLLS